MSVIFSAISSGSGKTTVVLGVLHTLCSRGWRIRPYKVGPDYIDTEYHRQICGCDAINLDGFLLSENQVRRIFYEYNDQDLAIVEGVMGLYDGLGSTHRFSTADIAHQIDAPIILIMDARGMAATAAAIAKGMQSYQNTNIGGIIFNRMRSVSHYHILKTAIERDTGIPCLGYLPEDEALFIPSRHLGIVPHQELEGIERILSKLRQYMEKYIDLDRLVAIARAEPRAAQPIEQQIFPDPIPVTLAVAADSAFSFYYHDNLRMMERAGAKLVFFSPLDDADLPACDGVYLGGGFPEVFALQLEKNRAMRRAIFDFAQSGKPIFAECGGYMYLMDSIVMADGKKYEMCGVFKGSAQMQKKLNMQFGYVESELLHDTPIGKKGKRFRNHEFHHSEIVSDAPPIYTSKKISTGRQWQGGHQVKNCFGTYSHIYFRSDLDIMHRFLLSCRERSLSR